MRSTIIKSSVLIFLVLSVLAFNSSTQTGTDEKTCMDCHGKLVAKKIPHKPVTEGCIKCHTSNGKEHPQDDIEGFVLTQKVPQLCFTCHQNKYEDANIHKPVKDGDCLTCHPVHSSDQPHLTALLPPKQCYFCHTDLKDTVARLIVVHSPMKDSLSCLICHSPHSSPQKKILLMDEKTLCFSCHDKPVIKDNRTIPNMKQLIEKSKYVHAPIDNNGCSECHNPHASKNQNLIKEFYPPGNYAVGIKNNYNQCFSSCHEITMIEDSTSRETGFRNKSRNLHYLHVNKDKSRTCNNCHDVHASNNLYLLVDKVKFGEWEMPLQFKKIDRGGSCAPGCHGEKTYVK